MLLLLLLSLEDRGELVVLLLSNLLFESLLLSLETHGLLEVVGLCCLHQVLVVYGFGGLLQNLQNVVGALLELPVFVLEFILLFLAVIQVMSYDFDHALLH